MSTRVQKGGTVFKPIARAKSRAVSAAGSSVRQSISVTETCTTPHSTATSPRPSVEPNAAGEAPVTPRPTSPPPTLQPVPERAELDVPPALQSRNTLPPPITRHPRAISTPARPPDRPPTVSAGPSISSSFRSTESHVPLGRNTEPSSPIPLPEPSLTSKPPLPSSKATAPSSSQLPPRPLSEFQLDFSAIVERAARAELFSPTHDPTSEPQIPAGSNVKLRSAVKLNTSGPVKPTHPARKRATSNSVNGDPGEDIPPKRRRTRTQRSDVRDGQAGDSNAVEVEKSKPRTRRATRVTSPSHLDDEGTPKARKRTTSRQTRSSSAPFDSNVDPGEELDPTVVTMADICEDTGQGRVSSKATQIFENHAAWKRSNRERRAQMRATMEARKYGHNGELDGVTVSVAPAKETEDGEQHPLTSSAPLVDSSIPQLQSASKDPGDFDEDAEGEDDGFDYSKVVGGSRFAARVRIGANGETVIDESSLFIDRTEEHETENYTHVEESDATKFTNSSTYSRRCHGSRWSGEETELFYDALRQFGENYELISFILPGRDRKACKNKFKAEDKKNPARINYCLANRVPYDMATLSRMTGKDFSGPTPEIRAKTPPNVTTLEQNTNGDPLDSPNTTRKKSRTPGPPEESSTVKRSSNTRKKGKNKEEEGVEILGAADGDWDD